MMTDFTQYPKTPIEGDTFTPTSQSKELEQWRTFGHNAFMLLFTTAEEQPDHKWLNDNGWLSSTALFSDLNNLLKVAISNT
jgi:hypothetical protein